MHETFESFMHETFDFESKAKVPCKRRLARVKREVSCMKLLTSSQTRSSMPDTFDFESNVRDTCMKLLTSSHSEGSMHDTLDFESNVPIHA